MRVGTAEEWQPVFDGLGGEGRFVVVPGGGNNTERYPVGEQDLVILVDGRKRMLMTWWLPSIAAAGISGARLYEILDGVVQPRSVWEAAGVILMRCESLSHGAPGNHGHHMIPAQVDCLGRGHELGREGSLRPPCDVCGGRASVPVV